jgi:hypothetical protein
VSVRTLTTRRLRWAFFSQMNASSPLQLLTAPAEAPVDGAGSVTPASAAVPERTSPPGDATFDRVD